MKVQLFIISVDPERTIFDQNSLNDFLSTVNFKKSSVQFVESEHAHWSVLVHYEEDSEEAVRVFGEPVASMSKVDDLTVQQQEIFSLLKQWRNKKALELNFSAYRVAHNSELIQIALQNPQSVSQLRTIKGFGELKTTKYGDEIIAILKGRYSNQS